VRASEQDRPDVAERREAWRRAQKDLGGRLIFLDETWTTTAMTRRYAWADVGARAIGDAPNGHWKTTTFLAGLTCEGLMAPFVLDGPINAECFLAYVEQILVPVLRQGDTVILDNLSSHKNEEGRTPHRRRRRAPTIPAALQPRSQSDRDGIRQTQRTVAASPSQNRRRPLGSHRTHPEPLTPEECANYVRHCGYNPL
jgi:hypothetical protein